MKAPAETERDQRSRPTALRHGKGLGGQLIEVKVGATSTKRAQGKVVCRSLGGMLNYYHREAA